ncbi:hypothetical protein [Streptomyces sp. NPDC048527]|uniref:hypothetical protein n=1 Tax=Streptomyces sp. NPDC048527 TaxID=3365568 RepID=UPI003722C974
MPRSLIRPDPRKTQAPPPAVANAAGGVLGARTALRRGAGFVRVALLCTVVVLVVKLAIDHWA